MVGTHDMADILQGQFEKVIGGKLKDQINIFGSFLGWFPLDWFGILVTLWVDRLSDKASESVAASGYNKYSMIF